MSLVCTCHSGLEPVLEKELMAFGVEEMTTSHGAITIPYTDMKQIYELNFMLRSATRILLPLFDFPCRSKEDLYKAVEAFDWSIYFPKNETFAIDAHVHNKAFTNSFYAAQVAKDAICDRLRRETGTRPSIDTYNPKVQLNLYMDSRGGVMAFDTSGRALHERGYRQEGAVAPLRENLAAALLLLANYSPDVTLLDPCAGVGTFLIEAALIATNTPPQFMRPDFGFMRHPEFQKKEWEALRASRLAGRRPMERDHIFGIEKERKTFIALERTIARAGFRNEIVAICDDFRRASLPKKPNFVIANPPYGRRLEDAAALIPLYRALGEFMKQATQKPARGFVLAPFGDLAKNIGLRSTRRTEVNNGGIECRFMEFELYG
jgi:putative N6-adenine-specific DNA methylase